MTARRMLFGIGAGPLTRRGTGALIVGAVSTITNDSKYNSWPSACLLANGSLFAPYAKSNGHNLDNSGIIVTKTSADFGASWSGESTIASDQPSYGNINPAAFCSSSGRVLASYNYFQYPIENPDYVRVKYSDDNAATWSTMYVVDSTFTSWNANGTMAQLGDGTILLAFYGLDIGGTHPSCHVMFSTDDGATFHGEVVIAAGDTDGRDYLEPALVVLANGDVLCLMRTSNGTGNVYMKRSTDGGATWSAASVAFGGYSTPNVIRLRTGTLLATVRGNAAAELEAFTSIDDGASWQSQGIIHTGFTESEYGCAVQGPDGRIIVIDAIQPTSSTSNADVTQVYLTEVLA